MPFDWNQSAWWIILRTKSEFSTEIAVNLDNFQPTTAVQFSSVQFNC